MIGSEHILANPIPHYPQATVACFDPTQGDLPRRRLDPARCVRFLEKLAEQGVPAVLIGASTGHGHLRTVEELEEWFACAARARLRDTVPMALLRPEDGAAANRKLVAHAADLGYAVIFIRPGRDLLPTSRDEDVAGNMAPLVAEAAARGLAVGVYSIPDVSGLPLSAEATARLLHGPGGDRIVAAKITEADYERSTLRYLEHPQLQHLKIVQGWDPHLARALQEGPKYDAHGRQRFGITSGPMSLAVLQYRHILDAAAAGDWGEVQQAQQAVTAVFASMQDDPRYFADLQRAKYVMGLGPPLTGSVTDRQVERMFAALAALPRAEDRQRMILSLDLMEDGPYHARLQTMLKS
jgi:dihydrodipicolinate synthase/N-acetylneuraminate lyase